MQDALRLSIVSPLLRQLDITARNILNGDGRNSADFLNPPGEAALLAPQAVSWRVFKNPVALFIGGVSAVILELAEPRVRSGVWDHTNFRERPVERLRHTGLAAMLTVYGAASVARQMISRVNQRHRHVTGHTEDGVPYRAEDPELLRWVHATAGFGFLQAYHTYVHPLSQAERDRSYAESSVSAELYGAVGSPRSEADLERLFLEMKPHLRSSPIVFEFLDIMQQAPLLPAVLRPAQRLLIRAAVNLTPVWARDILGLDRSYGLRPWEGTMVRQAGAFADMVMLPSSPAVQACQRVGLPANHLYSNRQAARAA